MLIITLISRLLDYPSEVIFENKEDILQLINDDTNLSEDAKAGLIAFVSENTADDLLDWQAYYDGLFERGRSLSLLIYEHLHGESRDRGQAMVNLLNQYKAAGLNLGVRELPDYLPLFLEFASTQGDEHARGWLEDIAPILALLFVRLEKRESNYKSLFQSLLELSGAKIDINALRDQVKDEKRDDTKKALDKVWEEEAVTFGGDAVNGGCPSATSKPSESQRRDQDIPISFVNAAANNPQTNDQGLRS